MHRVQARTRRVTPPTTARTSFRFRCHLRLVTLCAWLILRPVMGVFPQNWQCWAMVPPKKSAESYLPALHRATLIFAGVLGGVAIPDFGPARAGCRPAPFRAGLSKAVPL